MINVGDNFSYLGAKPLDGRLKYDTLADMKAVSDVTMYEGCLAYCVGTSKTYQWKSTNTVDTDTGKWREFTSGGGGGGHTIEDAEGTDLTQRDTMQFGDGLSASDDDTNEKTVVEIDEMPSADMSEVVSPLPSVQPRRIKYSTEEQVIGEWVDGKTVYQKSFVNITIAQTSLTTILENVDTLIKCDFSFIRDNARQTEGFYASATDWLIVLPNVNETTHNFYVYWNKGSSVATPTNFNITLQYTKSN